MARGWESKSVEDQMREAEAEKVARAKPPTTAAARESHSRRAGLLLSRTRVVNDLAAATDPRHRVLLERTLAHIDQELERV
ncbi:MAG TPA: hypothetical protein VH701_26150 [Vicinamibacterales bacterium]|jgi:hypothetical protein